MFGSQGGFGGWDSFAMGIGSAIAGGQNTANALKYNDIAGKYAINNQIEVLDKSSPVLTAAYKQKRMTDSQVDRLNSFKDIALMPRDYKYWN